MRPDDDAADVEEANARFYRAFETMDIAQMEPVWFHGDQLHRNRGFAGLRPYHRPAPLAGTAVTVRTRAGDNLAILRAFEFCRPGDVMVVDADGDCANALVGGILTFYAASIGLAGMVLNGAIRGFCRDLLR